MKSTLTTIVLAGLFGAFSLKAGHLMAQVAQVKDQGNADKLEVTSGMFENGATLPSVLTCDGAGIPPMLAWSGAPDGTKSYAVEVRDLDAKNGKFAHWIVTGIPKNIKIGRA